MKRAVFLLPIILSGCNGQDHASITCFQPSKLWIAASQAPNAHNVIENVIVVEPNGSVLVNGDEAKSRQFDAFLDDIKAKQFKMLVSLWVIKTKNAYIFQCKRLIIKCTQEESNL